MRRTCSVAVVALAVSVGAAAQYLNLVAPGDGSALYFSESQPLKGSGEAPQNRIYRVSRDPLELLAERPAPVPPQHPPADRPLVSSYFSLERFDMSSDGSVTATTGRNECYFSGVGHPCTSVGVYRTTVSAGPVVREFDGGGWLSANGRYLLTADVTLLFAARTVNEWPGAISRPYTGLSIVDLSTGEKWPFSQNATFAPKTSRLVSGTGRAAFAAGTSLQIQSRGETKMFRLAAPSRDAVIDGSGSVVVFTSRPYSELDRIGMFRPDTGEESILYDGSDDAYDPAITVDGRHVAFIMAAAFQWFGIAPGAPQLFIMSTDGSALRQITSDRDGVARYVLSDDGRTAWYVSRAGRLVRAYTATTVATDMLPPAPELSITADPVAPTGSAMSGRFSALTIDGVAVDGLAAPVISMTRDTFTFQVPWELGDRNEPVPYVVSARNEGPFDATFRGTIWVAPWSPRLIQPIHGDWSGAVTNTSPAKPGEVVHFYATGLGPVSPSVPTGVAPDGPAWIAAELSCDAELLYAGLAPGLIGYYQLTIRVPSSGHGTTFPLECTRPPFGAFGADLPVAF